VALHKIRPFVLAGRPSMGKTSLATQTSLSTVAKATKARHHLPNGQEGTIEGRCGGLLQSGMSAEQLAARNPLSEAAEVPSEQIRVADHRPRPSSAARRGRQIARGPAGFSIGTTPRPADQPLAACTASERNPWSGRADRVDLF